MTSARPNPFEVAAYAVAFALAAPIWLAVNALRLLTLPLAIARNLVKIERENHG